MLPPAISSLIFQVIQPILLVFVYVGVPLLVGFCIAHSSEIGRKDKYTVFFVTLIAIDAVSKTWVLIRTSPLWNQVLVHVSQSDNVSPQIFVGVWLTVAFLGWWMS